VTLPAKLPPLPAILPPEVVRFNAAGMPAPDQVRYEHLLHIWFVALTKQYVPLDGSTLPTVNPHVVGQIWSNGGILTVSAG
jgi:hypothetical protein